MNRTEVRLLLAQRWIMVDTEWVDIEDLVGVGTKPRKKKDLVKAARRLAGSGWARISVRKGHGNRKNVRYRMTSYGILGLGFVLDRDARERSGASAEPSS